MTSVVYFIQSKEGPVKIGWTANLAQRRVGLSTARGLGEVLASLPGGEDLEAHFHELFAEHRLSGDWFKPHPSLLSFAEAVRSGSYTPPVGFAADGSQAHRVRFVLADAIAASKVEASELVKIVAGPMSLGDKNEHAWRRVEKLTGIPRKRVKTLWYREAHIVHAAELDRLREVAGRTPPLTVEPSIGERLARIESALCLVNSSENEEAPRAAHRSLVGGR